MRERPYARGQRVPSSLVSAATAVVEPGQRVSRPLAKATTYGVTSVFTPRRPPADANASWI